MSKGKHVTAQEEEVIDKMRKQGEKLKYIAFKLDKDIVTVARHSRIKYVHNKWSDSDKQKAHEFLERGYSHQEIAYELNRTQDAVRQFFYYERKKGIITIRGGSELWETGNGGKKKHSGLCNLRPWATQELR